jgi:hypothetical protein
MPGRDQPADPGRGGRPLYVVHDTAASQSAASRLAGMSRSHPQLSGCNANVARPSAPADQKVAGVPTSREHEIRRNQTICSRFGKHTADPEQRAGGG